MFEKLFRSFRATLTSEGREEFTLEEEIALYRYRADLALQEERWTDALVFLAKILRLNPYDLQARMAVAWTYHYKLGEPTKALLTYEKVIAAAGYDESNSYSAAAREGIRELAFSAEVPSLPMDGLMDEESGAESSGDAPRSAAV
jgi:tetratricopeptide (TPR) repeat protein